MSASSYMPLLKRSDRPMLLSSGGKAGGGAKTSGLLAVSSLALLAGLRIVIIDADAEGTRAISKRVQHPDIRVIPLDEKHQNPARLLEALPACDLILFDAGAGELTNERTLLPLIRLSNHVGGLAGNAGMLVSHIPNKDNIINDLMRTNESLGDLLDMHIVRHNIDSTKRFDALPPALALLPCHDVPHLSPEILRMPLPAGWLPADFIRHGLSGYERLRGAWADHLLTMGRSNGLARWLGLEAALPILEHVAASKSSRVLPPGSTARQMTDSVVDGWADVRRGHDWIMSAVGDADIVAAVLYYRERRAHVDNLLR